MTFDPDYTQAGLHQVRFIATANSLADTQLVDITVNNIDLPPALDTILPQLVDEGGHLDVRVTASDPDGDIVTLIAEQLPVNSAFVDSTGGVGGLTFDPDYTQAGIHQVRFIAISNTLADTQLVDITVNNIDLAPTLDPIPPQTIAEGEHLDLRINSSDPDGDAITLIAELLPANSAFVDSTGGVGGMTFDPDYTQAGIHQLRFIASSNSLADTQLVDITVNNIDLPPAIAAIPPQTLDEGGHLDLRVSASDPDGDIITLIAEQLPLNSAFVDSTGGVGGLTFDPDYTQAGVHQVRFIASSNSLADTQLVDITVNNIDLPPVLTSIPPQSLDEGTHLDVQVTATDSDGDIITLIAEQLPPNSNFVDSTGGVGGLTFDPDYTQSGFYQVRFIASSNTLADTQLVDITVNNVDLPPAIDPISPQILAEGGHLDLRVTASDPDGDAITLIAELLPVNSAFVDSTGGVGGLTFDPDFTQSGAYQVRFIASSNTLADTQLVDITVNEYDLPPVLTAIPPQTLDEGTHLDLLVTASDPDGDALTLIAELLPVNSAFVDSTGGVGGLTFDPDYTQAGIHQVRFIASSNLLADTQLVDITVNNIDLPPTIAAIPPQTLDEGTHLDLRVTATDPDGDAITLIAELLPANSAFVDSTGGVGGMTFDPDYTQAGLHQVRFIASSNTLADTQLVDITVTNSDLPPVLDTILPQIVDEGDHLDLRVTASDPDGDAVTLIAELLPLNSVFVDSTGGVGGLTFDPDYTQSNVYQVRFIASSNALADTQLVDITVNNIDLPPVLTTIPPQILDEGTHLDVQVTTTDPDGDIITLIAEQLPPNSAFVDSTGGVGGLTFDPDYTQSGFYQVRFIASSNTLADTQLVDITVNNIDLPPAIDPISPQIVAEGGHLDLRVTASDPDGDAITLIAEQLPLNSAFVDSTGGIGGLTFDPDFTQQGAYQVRFIASSNTLADTQLVDITVNEFDLPPSIDPIPPQTVAEGGHLDVRVTASDPDGDVISLIAELLPANSVFLDSTGGVGGLTFDPDYTQAGVHQVRFIASSNSLADTQLVDITINNIDLPPALAAIPPQALDEGTHLDIRVTATDPDGDAIAIIAEQLPINSAFVDSTGGVGGMTFDPDFTQSGVHQLRFIASSNSLADTQLVDITVNNIDLPPVLATIPPQTLDEGTHLDIQVTATDSDGDAITLIAELLPVNSAFVDSTGGVGGLTFDPDYTQSGFYQVRFIASSNALADTQLIDITVNNVDLPPIFDPIPPQIVVEGGHLDLRIVAVDPDFDSIILSADSLPTNSAFVDSTGGIGGLTFDPDFTQVGVYQVRFIADANGLTDTAFADITVIEAGNQAPVLDPIPPQTVNEVETLIVVITASDADSTIPVLTAIDLPPNSTFADSGNGTGVFVFTPDYFQASLYYPTFIASDGSFADSQVVEVTVIDIPRVPVWDPISDRALFEGESITFGVFASDPDLTFPTLSVEPSVINAVFVDSLNGRGSYNFLPDFTQAGQYILTFIAFDGVLADSEEVNIFVFEAGNQVPEIDSVGPQSVVEGQHIEFPISSNDPDSTIPALQAFNLPTNAVFADSGNGRGLFSFDPDFTQSGVHNVLFRAFDGGLYDSMWVEITVIDFGFPPVLDPIGPQSVTEGQVLNVLVTSSDPDATFPQLLTGSLPVNALFIDSLNGNGLLTFAPDYSQAGIDTVLFIATDGALSDSEYVEITVIEAGNQTPVLDPINSQTFDEGTLLQLTVAANDPDSTIPLLATGSLPANATFTDNFDGSGLFEFAPDYTQSAVYFITFIASDGVAADSQVVTVRVDNVNLAPVLDSIPTPQSIAEGSILDVRITSSDPDGNIPVLGALNLPSNATFVDSLNGAGGFVFSPDYTQEGSYQVLFTASDGFIIDSQYVDITVTNTDLSPILDPIPPQTLDEGTHLDIRITAADIDGDVITLIAEQLPANSAFVDSTGGVGGLTFDPDYTQSNVYQVRIIAASNTLADTQLVDITVNNIDLPPVFAAIPPQIMDEGTHLDLQVTATDPDGDIITLIAEQLPPNSAFVDSTGGVGGLTFDPDYTQSGLYQVRFIANSNTLADTQLVDITVNEVDLSPILDPIPPQSVAEGGHLDVRVTASDADGDIITLIAEQLPANSVFVDSTGGVGGLTFDPDFTQQGFYQVRIIASSNALVDTQHVDITVTGSDLPPVLDLIPPQVFDEGTHLDLRVTASDPDGDPITLIAEQLPPNSAFVDSTGGVGGLTFDPDYTQSGVHQIRFIANSNTLADTQLVDITVNNVDLPPVLDPITPQFFDEGTHLDLRVTASDPDGDIITLIAEQLPVNSAFVDSTGGVGGLTFDPDYAQSGFYQVRLIANSNTLADTQLVDITVNEVDLPPVLNPIAPQTMDEGMHLDLRMTATDPDGDMITLIAEQLPANSAFVDSTGGVGGLTFDPDYTQAGVHQVRFIASSNALVDTQLVDITVNNIDLPPVLAAIPPQTLDEGTHLDLRVTAADLDGDIITLIAEQLPANSAFVDSTAGIGGLIFDPDYTQSGFYQVRFIASSNSRADTQLVDITVNNIDLPPLFDPIPPQSVVEGGHLDLRVVAVDPDADIITLIAEQLPVNSAFVDSTGGIGGLIFDPDFTQVGVYQVRFIATSGGLVDTAFADITVFEAGNQAPVMDPIGPQSVNEAETLTVVVTSSDPDGQIPALTALNLPPNSMFADSGDGTGLFVFYPDYFQEGIYLPTFIASDGVLADSETVEVTVIDTPRPPIWDTISDRAMFEGESINFGVSASDPDGTIPVLSVEPLPVNAVFVDSLNGKGSFSFSPDYTQAGQYSLTYIATDGVVSDSEFVDIFVFEAGNQAPEIDSVGPQSVVEGQHIEFPISSNDPDSTIPALQAFNLPTNAVFADSGNGRGLFSFDPDFIQAGVHNVLFRAFDGALYDSMWVEITVIDFGFPPVLDPIGPQSVTEGQVLNVLVTSTDPDATFPQLLTGPLPVNAVFTDSLNGHGLLTFAPDYSQAGIDTVLFFATDGALSDSEYVEITIIEAGNQTPNLDPISPQTFDEGTLLQMTVTASDPDSTIPSFSTGSLPANATFTDNFDGSGLFEFAPDYTQSGVYFITFIASDGVAADSQAVTVRVNNVNLAPVLDSIATPQAVAEGSVLDIRVTSSDPDATIPVLDAFDLPVNSTFVDSLNGAGGFVFSPDYTQEGPYQVLFTASDGFIIDSQYVDITVTNIDLPPILDPMPPQVLDEGTHLDIRVTASDIDGDAITLIAEQLPANSAFVDSTGGVGGLTFDPDYTQSNVYQVRIIAASNTLADTQLVDITVNNIDLPPVFADIPPQIMDEGAHLDLQVTASDPDGDIITLIAEQLPTNSAFDDSTGGVGGLTFDPDYTQSGVYQVRFIANSNTLADTQLVDITVNNIDLAPVIDPVSPQTVAEGSHLDVRITASDFDGDVITLIAEQLPANSAFVDSTGGVGGLTFDPDYTQQGFYPVRIIASSNALVDTQFVDITVTGFDLPPVLDPIPPQALDEGTHLDLRVTASDPDGDPITLIAEQLPVNSAFVDSTGGVGGLTFDPDFTQQGAYQVRFIANSNTLADTQLVDITVNNIDLPPVLSTILAQTIDEGTHFDLRVTATDPDGDVITLIAEQLPVNSAFVDSTGGVGGMTFDPDYTQSGFYQVRFIAGSNALADTQLVDITVNNIDLPPVLAAIPSQTLDEGDHLDVRVTAIDPDGDIIILIAEQLPVNSAFVDSTGGVGGLTFDPDFAQSGIHQIRFIASSNTLADTQLVDITVNNIDLPPVLAVILPQTMDEGNHLDVRVTATDPDGDIINLIAEQLPANSAFVDSSGGVGGLTFDPDFTQSGVYQVRLIANSNTLADTQLVDITVNNIDLPPLFDPIPPQTIVEGGHLDLRIIAIDPDFDNIVLTADSLPFNSVFVDSTGGIGGMTFDPDFTQVGIYQVRFIATANGLTDTAFADITVLEAGNQSPLLDPIGPQTVNEAETLTVVVTSSDPDGQIPVLAALNLPPNSMFADSGNGTGVFVFNPDYFQSSVYNVTFIASDGILADSEAVEITVFDTPRPPVWEPINNRALFEGETINFGVSASDPDLTFPTLSAEPPITNAVFVDSLNGRGSFSFSPDYTQAGEYLLTFIASDGVLTDSEFVDIFVFESGNQAPEIDSVGPQSVVEGQHLEFLISSNDADGTIPALQALNLPTNAVFADSGNGRGLFSFDPDFSQAGVHDVLFRAFDGELYDSMWVEITVIDFGFPPVLDPIGPQSVTEGQILFALVTSSDPDGTYPELTAGPLPLNAVFEDSLNGHGLLIFAPDYTQSGIDTVLFIATDGALSDSEYVEITIVEAGNQPPVLNPIGSQNVDENVFLQVIVSAGDPDGSIPSLSTDILPPNATFVDNLDGTGTFEFTPDYTQSGIDTVLFIAGDEILSDSEYVEITINNINLPPALDPIPPQTTFERFILRVLITASDPDGTIPSLSADSLPLNATFYDSTNGVGVFEFLPEFDQAGVYNVLFAASDGILVDTTFMEITVLETNRQPVFDPVSDQQVPENDSLFFTVQATDPDGQVPTLTYISTMLNTIFSDSGNGTGLFEYRPDYTQSGIDTVMFEASDGDMVDTLRVQITTIEAGNQPPVLEPIGPRIVDEGQLLQFNVYAGDPDNEPISLVATGLPMGAVFFDSSNGVGTFTFTPSYFHSGLYRVLFSVSDGALIDTERVEITVNNVNRPPVLLAIGNHIITEGDSLGLNITATDADNETLTFSADSLELNMTFADSGNGSAFFMFLSGYAQSGVYNLTFSVSDGIDSDTEFVQIDVLEAGNQSPVLAPIDTAYYVSEGLYLEIPVSATDAENEALILSADSLVENMVFADYGDGTALFSFSPNYVQAGAYPLRFMVYDGLDYDSAFTTIYVAEEGNQPPILTGIGPQTVSEGDSLEIYISAVDPEGSIPRLYLSGNPDSSYFTDYGDGTGRFIYYPDFYSAGLDTIRFTAVDNVGLSDYEDVEVTITDINLSPIIAVEGDTLVHEGDTLITLIVVYDSSDFDPGPLSLSNGYLPPNSEFVITGNGVGEFRFYPGFEQSGIDSAYFFATDSDEPPLSTDRWVHFVVTPENRPPVLEQSPGGEVNQGDTLIIDITATDPDGDSLVLFINCECPEPLPPRSEFLDNGDGTGKFIFYPDFTQQGLYIIYFAATDGEYTDTKPALVNVRDMGNQTPTLNPIGPLSVIEGDSLEILITSTDPDSTFPMLFLEDTPYNLVFTDSANGTASLTFAPFYNQAGISNMLFFAVDTDGAADSEYVELTVIEAGNQYPELDSLTDQIVNEGNVLQFFTYSSDPDSTIPVMQANNLPENAIYADSADGRGLFRFEPHFFQAGQYQVTFLAVDFEDPALADSQTITITVNDVNRPPEFVPIIYPFTMLEGENLNFLVESFDADSTTPSLAAQNMPENATFTDNGDGTGVFDFNPNYFQSGVDTVYFMATDEINPNIQNMMRVFIIVEDVNRPPVLDPIPDTTIGDGFMLTLNITSFDPDSTTPVMFHRTIPDLASFTDLGDGTATLTWRPRYEDIGTYLLTFGCYDQFDPTMADSQVVTIQVITAGNHPPIFNLLPEQQVHYGDTLEVLITATDVENDPLAIFVGEMPWGMTFTDSGNGLATLHWVPLMEQGGDWSVSLSVFDDGGLSDTMSVNIFVITYIRGDANGNGIINIADVIFLFAYLNGNGIPPDPLEAGDANGNGIVNIADVIYLFAYLTGNGPPPPPPVPPSPPDGGGNIDIITGPSIKPDQVR
ncbi:MAG: Ig-like domain-containing protein [candidate division Zixibacteria bacterium]